ncbi:MAG TPA: PIN domain-containing protein [Thermoanaerobaculia bacterium]|nr:PIN domain-containing protein [Thermoanaerobaculia bacterium]
MLTPASGWPSPTRKDRHYEVARQRLESLDEGLVTTWPVVTETCYLLLERLGPASVQSYVHAFAGGAFDVFDLRREDAPKIAELIAKYADLPMDLADASLVILAEHLGHGRILSTDQRDFHAYRWKQRRPFENLLIDSR